MKILMLHNYYQQAGGEDQVFADESWLLQENGHEVIKYMRHNKDIDLLSDLSKFRKTLWNRDTVADLEPLIRRHRPAIMHCTNTFPLISPAAFTVAQRHGVKVVQSIHNYRLMCPNATFLRNGSVCEECLGKPFAYPGIRYACYRNNRAATAVVATFQAYHRMRKTYHQKVDRIIALSEFSRQKLIEGGLPAAKMVVKSNFVHPDPGVGEGDGDYVLFVGRLSVEKGIDTLLDCWRAHRDLPELRILGDGPLGSKVMAASETIPNVTWLGRQPLSTVYETLGSAQCLIVPSIWYEVCPKTILEAFAKATPVIASRLGGMSELVDDGRTGRLFDPGNIDQLATAVKQLCGDKDAAKAMRASARDEFQQLYTPERNYEQLIGIFRSVLGAAKTSF